MGIYWVYWVKISDKCCEQYGYCTTTGTNTQITVTLLKSYRDTNYNIQFTQQGPASDNYYDEDQWVTTRNVDSFLYYNSDKANCNIFWRTVGYIN